MMEPPSVSAIVLAFGEEATLERCIRALIVSTGVDLEIVVVNNGASPAALASVAGLDRVSVVGPPENRGFAGGCNFGVMQSTGSFVALINSDAFVEPDALEQLIEVAGRPGVGLASASVRLADRPDTLNSVGNPVHYTGLSWAGSFGALARDHIIERDVASASGAAVVARRDVWDRLYGFDATMFAYLEDTEISLRCWQQGLAVRFVPTAVVAHDYEFSRNDLKFYLLERNRLFVIATLYECRTCLLLAPALAFFELAMIVQALTGSWFLAKVRGWMWMIKNRRTVRARRQFVQSARTVPDRDLIHLLEARITPTNIPLPLGFGLFNAVLAAYWRIVKRLI